MHNFTRGISDVGKNVLRGSREAASHTATGAKASVRESKKLSLRNQIGETETAIEEHKKKWGKNIFESFDTGACCEAKMSQQKRTDVFWRNFGKCQEAVRAFEGKIAQLQEEIAAVDAGYDADKAGREQRRKAAQDADKALQIQREADDAERAALAAEKAAEAERQRLIKEEENRKKAKEAEKRAAEAAAEKERIRKEREKKLQEEKEEKERLRKEREKKLEEEKKEKERLRKEREKKLEEEKKEKERKKKEAEMEKQLQADLAKAKNKEAKKGTKAKGEDGPIEELPDLAMKAIGSSDFDPVFDKVKKIQDSMQKINNKVCVIGIAKLAKLTGTKDSNDPMKVFQAMGTAAPDPGALRGIELVMSKKEMAMGKIDLRSKVPPGRISTAGASAAFTTCVEAFYQWIQTTEQVIQAEIPPIMKEATQLGIEIAQIAMKGPALKDQLMADYSAKPFMIPSAISNILGNCKKSKDLPKFFNVFFSNVHNSLSAVGQGFDAAAESSGVAPQAAKPKAKVAAPAAGTKIAAPAAAAPAAGTKVAAAATAAAATPATRTKAAIPAGQKREYAILAKVGLTDDKAAAVMKVVVDEYGYSHLNEVENQKEAEDIANQAGLKGKFKLNFVHNFEAWKKA